MRLLLWRGTPFQGFLSWWVMPADRDWLDARFLYLVQSDTVYRCCKNLWCGICWLDLSAKDSQIIFVPGIGVWGNAWASKPGTDPDSFSFLSDSHPSSDSKFVNLIQSDPMRSGEQPPQTEKRCIPDLYSVGSLWWWQWSIRTMPTQARWRCWGWKLLDFNFWQQQTMSVQTIYLSLAPMKILIPSAVC